MLTIEQISCGFGRQEILHDISLTIPEGKITAIVGQSGCGKTTFLKTLNRMIEEEGGFYKGKIILAIIILAVCIALPVTIYKKSRPVALSYCIVNSPEPSAVDTSFVDEYLDFYNLNGAYQIHNDLTVHLDKDTSLEDYSQNSSASVYTELPMLCFNGYYDIMIMDEKGLEYCAMQEIIYPLKTYLPADIYSQISDRICTADDNDGVTVPFAIDISDTDFAKGLNLGYDKVYLGFPGNTEQNYTNAKRMVKFILHLDIDTETTF